MATLSPSQLDYLTHEIHSESTLPLLSWLLRTEKHKDVSTTKIFHQVKAGVGKDPRPIPDESEQVEEAMLQLMAKGPGDGTPITGSPKVTIVGAGTSGLCAGYELKKAGFNVTILEASSRVGGRVKTFRDPCFAPGLHGEGGAMRIPGNHKLLRQYIKQFKLDNQLFDFEMINKYIYISGLGRSIPYTEFDEMLKSKNKELLALFPGLRETEQGKTCDKLFNDAVDPVKEEFWKAYKGNDENVPLDDKLNIERVKRAYKAITDKYDKYSLRSYLTEVANWSEAAINLYDLGNAHVVFENGFIESWKDAFLSSNEGGQEAKMQQLQGGMDIVPKAFISDKPEDNKTSLLDNIIFGARVRNISLNPPKKEVGLWPGSTVSTTYETTSGQTKTIESNYIILAIPYTAQRAISKNKTFIPKQEMATRDVRYVEVTKVLLQYKKRWWEDIYAKVDSKNPDGGLVSDLPIRYTMFPKTHDNDQTKISQRGVIMAAYTFEQDATILSALSPERRIRQAAEDLNRIFPEAKSLDLLEVGASQCFPSDELAGGSAFCYFGPTQKSQFLEAMCTPDWDNNGDKRYRCFFAGEQASFTHGWIQGAFEAGLRCVQQIWEVAVHESKLM